MRVLAAMSGGVDSAVAAARAVDAGHDVTGVHLALSRNPASYRSGARGCCTIEDSNDARRAADMIGIPFYVWDMSDRFHSDVVEDFMAEYAAGRTPNPCLRCNEKIKFAAVLDRAIALGFDAVATGHYAVLRAGSDGLIELHRAEDQAKDQSYVLGVLTQSQLAHSLFPLGDTPKPLVREEAARRGLLVAEKPDSHDICFVADGDNAGWLKEKLGDRLPNVGGAIIDESGDVLGSHEGTVGFTIGQRKGLRLGRPAADGRPRFVLDIEPVSGTVTVGPREHLAVDRISGIRPRWAGTRPAVGVPIECTVQLRAHGEEHRAVMKATGDGDPTLAAPAGSAGAGLVSDSGGGGGCARGGGGADLEADGSAGVVGAGLVSDSGGGGGCARGGGGAGLEADGSDGSAGVMTPGVIEIELLDPAFGIAPGQAAVIYDGTRVVGSATIASTHRMSE